MLLQTQLPGRARHTVDIGSLPEMAHSIDGEGRIVDVSEVWLRRLGYRREQVLGRKSVEFLTPRSRDYATRTVLPRFHRDGSVRDVPYQFVHADGSIVDVQLSAVAEFDDAGAFKHSFALLKDVTELRHASTVAWLTESAVIADDRTEFALSVISRLRIDLDVHTGLLLEFQDEARQWAVSSVDSERRIGEGEAQELRAIARRVQASTEPEFHERLCPVEDALGLSACLAEGTRALAALPVQRPEIGHGVTSVLVLLLREPRFFTRFEQTALRLAAKLIGLVESRQEVHRAEMRNAELAQVTLSAIQDAVVRVDTEGRIEFVNAAAERHSGQTALELCGSMLSSCFCFETAQDSTPIPDLVGHARLAANGHMSERIVRWVSVSGACAEVEVQVRSLKGTEGEWIGDVLTLSDVTRARELSRELVHQATHDSLSGLINRREFEQRLSLAVRNTRDHQTAVLAYLDLDQFKVVNDTCGHAAGDQLIRQLAGLIASVVRKVDLVGRLGGDEFGILMPHCSIEEGRSIAEALLEAIGGFRFGWDDKVFTVGASFGLVPIESRDRTVAELLSAADRACYSAKDAGRNRIEIARPEGPSGESLEQMHWVPRIQRALFENRMELFAQPIVSLSSGESVACEILVRKRTLDGELIPPGAFLGAVERYHIATQLDRWVLEHTLSELADHRQELESLELITINLSGQSIGDAVFQEFAVGCLDRCGLPASKIGFEITETAAIANLQVAQQFIEVLSARGCRFLLDDFGSGLSSFGYLKDLPVDFVKIDGHFVRTMTEDPADFAVVRSIHEIATLSGKQTIAEHVDGGETMEMLQALGVQYAQGFGLGKPMPLTDLLANQRSSDEMQSARSSANRAVSPQSTSPS